MVDEVVLTPVEKVELIARVEMLLRARRLSLELRLRKDDVEAFIHAMTHDLRAPLRTVTGFAEAMAEDQSSRLDATGKHQLDRIQAAVRQMWELIESLVEYSRIGRKAIKLKPVDLDAVTRQCLEEMTGEIEAQGATVEIAGKLGEAEADRGFAEDCDSQPGVERDQVRQPGETAAGRDFDRAAWNHDVPEVSRQRHRPDGRKTSSASSRPSCGCTAWKIIRVWAWACPRPSAWWRSSAGRSASRPTPGREARSGSNLMAGGA